MFVRFASLSLSLLLLSGCVSPLSYSGTPEQLRELAKVKDATVTCVTVGTPYGNGRALFLSLDKGVLPGGSFSVDDACKATITVTSPEKK